MTNKTDWIVHYVSNNVHCDECGKREDSFLPCLCNAHTHGMKKYNHLDFQIVLDLGAQEVCRILNELGRRVRAGHRFTAGEMIPGVYEDCAVRLDIAEETGREVYRVIIPDRNYLFPEDPLCCGIYPQQLVNTEDLCAEKMNGQIKIKLYQMRRSPECEMFIFKDVYALKQHYGEVPAELYECVYSGLLAVSGPGEVYRIFNSEFPKGYSGRSMSVSDIVEFEYKYGRKVFYYCDCVGFSVIEFADNRAHIAGGARK